MNRGYVKVWRKIEDSGLLGNAEHCQLFLFLLIKASRKERKYSAGNQVINLLPGQFVTGRKQLAAELGSTEQRIRTALKFLEKHEIINQQATNKFTIISIINWNRYQDDQPAANQQSNQQLTSTQPATNQQLTTKQECKNEEVKKEEEEKKASKTRARGGKLPDYDDMVNAYTRNQDLKTALGEFIVMRKAAKKPFTNAALTHTFTELDKLAGADDAAKIAMLNQSVQRGWLGVFAVKIGMSAHGNTAAGGRERDYGQSEIPDWAQERGRQ